MGIYLFSFSDCRGIVSSQQFLDAVVRECVSIKHVGCTDNGHSHLGRKATPEQSNMVAENKPLA
jgi:hypothetical protein